MSANQNSYHFGSMNVAYIRTNIFHKAIELGCLEFETDARIFSPFFFVLFAEWNFFLDSSLQKNSYFPDFSVSISGIDNKRITYYKHLYTALSTNYVQ